MGQVLDWGRASLAEGGWLAWSLSLGLALLAVPIFKLALRVLFGRLARLARHSFNGWDDAILAALAKTHGWLIFAWVFFLLIRSFVTHEKLLGLSRVMLVAVSLVQIGLWAFSLLHYWRKSTIERKMEKDRASVAAFGLIYIVLQSVLVVALVLIGLSNVGVNIGALLAGLGVGGIAIALAAQNILGDLFASLAIVLDKPFVVGDFIEVDGKMGDVERIGLKTTRVRSLSGEELIFANKDLLESRVRNYKRMFRRRVVQSFSLDADTPLESVERIPRAIRAIVERESQIKFDRCHLASLGESFQFELVYLVENPDFNFHMDRQQKFLLEIMKILAAEKARLAQPIRLVREMPISPVPRVAGPDAPNGSARPLQKAPA